jgi:hypothetical protein
MNDRLYPGRIELIEARAGCGESRTSGSSGGRVSERNPSYPNYPFQKWLALLFVDPDGILSSILFKTESLDNFEELRRGYRVKGETLLGKTLRAHMAKRASKATGNGYYAVEFEVVSPGKYADAIAQFRQQHYNPAMFRTLTANPALETGNGQ